MLWLLQHTTTTYNATTITNISVNRSLIDLFTLKKMDTQLQIVNKFWMQPNIVMKFAGYVAESSYINAVNLAKNVRFQRYQIFPRGLLFWYAPYMHTWHQIHTDLVHETTLTVKKSLQSLTKKYDWHNKIKYIVIMFPAQNPILDVMLSPLLLHKSGTIIYLLLSVSPSLDSFKRHLKTH